MEQKSYTDINAETWDRWAADGLIWSRPIDHDTYVRAKNGDWSVLLTPSTPVPESWFLPFPGLRLLGLASGGGQQMPVFSALGANCTVFDYSKSQLASEEMVAKREGYPINIVRGDMTKPLPFSDGSFDLIFHPVSNSYIEDVGHVWRECFRVLRPGGVLLAGLDNGINFLFNDYDKMVVENKLPFNPLKNPAQRAILEQGDDGMQFSHFPAEQIGGQLEAGFRLTHMYDDWDQPGDGKLSSYVPLYFATRSVKPK